MSEWSSQRGLIIEGHMSRKWTPNSRMWETQRNDDMHLVISEQKTANRFQINGYIASRTILNFTDSELRLVKQAIADIEQKIKEIKKDQIDV